MQNAAVEEQNPEKYYGEKEQFHAILYCESGNSILEQECLRLQRRLQPFRCTQLRLRGRLKQSMRELSSSYGDLEDSSKARGVALGATGKDRARENRAKADQKAHQLAELIHEIPED